ncbi:MAG TPA: YdcF family protein [Ruminococcaceae bacterium]|nr:YdcF family protein [Oscillospiraceae bacterium]
MKTLIKIVKILFRLALIGFGCYYMFMFVRPVFGVIFNIGSVLGAFLSLIAILVGIFLNKIIDFCKKHYQSKKGKILLNTFFTVFTIGLLCFSLTLGSIVTSAKTNAKNESTVIILGCAVRGEKPSYTLNRRISTAYDYLTDHPDSVAVLSGGQGRGENISEAQCMYNVLTEKGIDPDRLYLEDKSTNTGENIAFSKQIIEENNLSTDIAVVSSDYHLKRATMICKKNGFDNVHRISSPSTYFDKPTFYLREVLGVVKEFIIR